MDALTDVTRAPALKLTHADLSILSKSALKRLLRERLTPGSSVELARALHGFGDNASAAKALRAHPLDSYNPAHWPFIGAVVTIRGSDQETDALLEKYLNELPQRKLSEANVRNLTRWVVRSGHPTARKVRWLGAVLSLRMGARWLLGAGRRRLVSARWIKRGGEVDGKGLASEGPRDTVLKRNSKASLSKRKRGWPTASSVTDESKRRSFDGLAEALSQLESNEAIAKLDEVIRAKPFLVAERRVKLALHLNKLNASKLALHLLKSINAVDVNGNKKFWHLLRKVSRAQSDSALHEVALMKISEMEGAVFNKYSLALLSRYRRSNNEFACKKVGAIVSDGLVSDLLLAWEFSDAPSPGMGGERLDELENKIHKDFRQYAFILAPFVLDSFSFRLPLTLRPKRSIPNSSADRALGLVLELLDLCARATTESAQWERIIHIIEKELLTDAIGEQNYFSAVRICSAYTFNAGKEQDALDWLQRLGSVVPEGELIHSLVQGFLARSEEGSPAGNEWIEQSSFDIVGCVGNDQRIDFLIWLSPPERVGLASHREWLARSWANIHDEKIIGTINTLVARGRADLAVSLFENRRAELLTDDAEQKKILQRLRNATSDWQLYGAEMLFDALLLGTGPARNVLLKGAEIKALLGKHNEARSLIDLIPEAETVDLGVIRACSRLNYSDALDRIAMQTEALAVKLLGEGDYSKFLDCAGALIELGRIELADELIANCINAGAAQGSGRAVEPNVALALQRLFARTRELLDDFDGAIAAYQNYAMMGSEDAHYLSGMARCLFMQGFHDQAMDLINRLPLRVTQSGERQFNLVAYQVNLSRGRFDQAFEGYRHRPVSDDLRKLVGPSVYPTPNTETRQPDGAHLRHLFVSEFGPGDELRFASLYGEISEATTSPTITCDPRLEPILAHSFPTINFIPVRRWRIDITSELRITDYLERDKVGNYSIARLIDNNLLGSLAYFDRVSFVLDQLWEHRKLKKDFHRRPYLKVKSAIQERWKERILERAEGRIVVGLSWRSMLQSSARSIFYTGIEDWKQLFARDDVMVVSLQPGAKPEEIVLAQAAGGIELFDDLDLKDDFMGVAAVMRACDVVYAPATTTLELAGAVGAHAVLLSMNEYTRWRLQPDGRDIWHGSVTVSHRPAKQRASEFVTDLCSKLDRETLRRIQAPLEKVRVWND